MKQRICILGVCLIMALATPVAAADSGPVLRLGIHTSKIGNMDPHLIKGSQDATFADLVFNSLVRYEPGNLTRMEPDIASEMPVFYMENGRQVWTVTLKKGVFFHTGPFNDAYELTADDVIFSLEKAFAPDKCSRSGICGKMSFRRLDDYSLEVILEKPISPHFFLPAIANRSAGYIVSKRAIQKGGYEAFAAHPVGTGPFRFQRYKAGESCVLTANDRYFRGSPKLGGVEIHFVPDNDKRFTAFENGDLDVILGSGDPGWIEAMEKTPGTVIDVFGPGYTGLLHLNTSIPPLDDIRVRQAIVLAMDREAFLSTTTRRLVEPVMAPMSAAFLPGGLSNDQIAALGLAHGTDLVRARELLAEAGYPDGFSMTLVVSEKRIYRKIYEILQQALADIGISVELTVVPHSKMHKAIRENLNPIVLYFTFRPNADQYLRGYFHSDSIVKTGISPHTNFSHCASVDRLLDDARLEIDPDRQVAMWEHAQIRILQEALAYPLLDIRYCVARKTGVRYGHEPVTTMAGYPQFTELTEFLPGSN